MTSVNWGRVCLLNGSSKVGIFNGPCLLVYSLVGTDEDG